MNGSLVFSLSELIRDIDILARFKKTFGFNEYQDTLTDIEKLGIEKNGDSKIFVSTDSTTALITNYKRLVGNPSDYVAFNLQTLKKVFDVLGIDKEEKDNVTVFVPLKAQKPCIVVNSHTAIVVAPKLVEELPENAEAEAEAETETEQETETQEAEAEPVPATA